MNKYTIIATIHTYGSITTVVEKNDVRKECKRLKDALNIGSAPSYKRIEVVNNDTGEIHTYWDSTENNELF